MNAALFLPNWVGDVVMATPAIRAMREYVRGGRLVAVCRPNVMAVVEGSPWFDRVILFDRNGPREQGTWAVAGQLRRERIDVAVLFPNSFRSAFIARLGGCRRRIGFARYGRSLLLTDRLKPVRDELGELKPTPAVGEFNRLVKSLGIPDPGHRLELFTTADDEAAAERVWRDHGLYIGTEVIGLNTGGAFGAAKDWPAESFAQLAQNLVDRRGSRVLVLCGPAERDNARRIVKLAGRSGVFSLADYPPSIGLSKACVRRLDLLVTTDSGPRHFAAAFDRPVLTIFGPTDIAWTETYFDKAVHVQKSVPCGPCQRRACPEGHHKCMRHLSSHTVFASAVQLLERVAPAAQGYRHAG